MVNPAQLIDAASFSNLDLVKLFLINAITSEFKRERLSKKLTALNRLYQTAIDQLKNLRREGEVARLIETVDEIYARGGFDGWKPKTRGSSKEAKLALLAFPEKYTSRVLEKLLVMHSQYSHNLFSFNELLKQKKFSDALQIATKLNLLTESIFQEEVRVYNLVGKTPTINKSYKSAIATLLEALTHEVSQVKDNSVVKAHRSLDSLKTQIERLEIKKAKKLAKIYERCLLSMEARENGTVRFDHEEILRSRIKKTYKRVAASDSASLVFNAILERIHFASALKEDFQLNTDLSRGVSLINSLKPIWRKSLMKRAISVKTRAMPNIFEKLFVDVSDMVDFREKILTSLDEFIVNPSFKSKLESDLVEFKKWLATQKETELDRGIMKFAKEVLKDDDARSYGKVVIGEIRKKLQSGFLT